MPSGVRNGPRLSLFSRWPGGRLRHVQSVRTGDGKWKGFSVQDAFLCHKQQNLLEQ